MLEEYITPSEATPSRSGLYANQLPGVTLQLLDDLTKDEQEDFQEFWNDLYARTILNFTDEVQAKLADKFHIDLELVSRETSKFLTTSNSGGFSGVKLEYTLPKYGKVHVLTVEVYANDDIEDAEIKFFDTDSGGALILTKTVDLEAGLNTINVDTDFSVDKLFIGYDADTFDLRGSENKFFGTYNSWSKLSCTFPCCFGNSQGSATQINGGGINAIYNVHCSIEKVIEQNINIFKNALWYRIGLELMRERILSDRFNRWTTLTTERATELQGIYITECEIKLSNSVRNLRMREDPVCFNCKSSVYSVNQLP